MSDVVGQLLYRGPTPAFRSLLCLMQKSDDKFGFRLPSDLKSKLSVIARDQRRTLAFVVIKYLEDGVKKDFEKAESRLDKEKKSGK
jgi:predicted DNA-binding protein